MHPLPQSWVHFAVTVIINYSLMFLKSRLFADEKKPLLICAGFLSVIAAVAGAYILCQIFYIDYGMPGVILAVAPMLCDIRPHGEEFDTKHRIICFGGFIIGQLFFSYMWGDIRWFSLLALIPLSLYNGKRGKHNMKYFFYIFYPAHLAIIEGIYMLVNNL